MKVILKQSGHGWIDLCIETNDTSIIIHTSSCFDPYERLYIWLGKIRDRQLPERMIIDEEGYGVELIVESVGEDNVFFHVEPWMCDDKRERKASATIGRLELVKAFHDGIIEFVENSFIPSGWSCIEYFSYQNWGTLMREDLKPDWNKRLSILDYYPRSREDNTDVTSENIVKEDLLTIEQKSILILQGVLERVGIAHYIGYSKEILELVNLYKTLPLDIILNEVDLEWYQNHREQLNIEHDHSWSTQRRKSDHYINLLKFRLNSLKIGQVIDGSVVRIRDYGIFVDFGGCRGILHISEISKLEIEDPKQIFEDKDWVRAIIIDLDVDRGRVTLSTRVLEAEAGDMLKEPWKVYEGAEEMAIKYHEDILAKK